MNKSQLALALLISTACFSCQAAGHAGKGKNKKDKAPSSIAISAPTSVSEVAFSSSKAITPKAYIEMLGKGMDVDWIKTGQGQEFYSRQIVKDFKAAGISHVRLRIKDDADEQTLQQLDRVVKDCISENLIPIIAYQGADFKGKPTLENLDGVVQWWSRVAAFGRNYPAQVSFDLIIEVTEALNKEPEMLNQLYDKTVSVIRSTNPTRLIFISPILRSAPEHLKDLRIPKAHNNYLMAEWHFYASGPDKQDANKKWTTGTEEEKNLIRAKINAALEWQKKTGIYTWVGAWMAGNYNKGDQYSVSEQVKFAHFVTAELTRNKIPFAFNSDVKFYDRENKSWIPSMKPVLDEIIRTSGQ